MHKDEGELAGFDMTDEELIEIELFNVELGYD